MAGTGYIYRKQQAKLHKAYLGRAKELSTRAAYLCDSDPDEPV